MSRHSKRKPSRPAPKRTSPAGNPKTPAIIIHQGSDGYANPAAFLGEDSVLLSSGTFRRSGLTANTELLTTAYRVSWLAKRIIDMPSEDMTRKWYTLNTTLDEEDLRDLKRLEAKHSIRQEITNAIRWARLYGGSIAVMVVRDGRDLSEPLELRNVAPNSFQGLLVLDRAGGVTPSLELVDDLDDPDFGTPMYYDADLQTEEMGHVRIHHSRVLKFTGRELPRQEMERESYWGVSELEHIWDELQNRNAASLNIAQLMFQANITTLKMGTMGDALTGSSDALRQRVIEAMQQENRFRTSYGIQVLSQDDQMETHSYSFAGISDVYEAFMLDMAGAAEIPATKLFGRSPQGLNANGVSDLKNYAEMISSLQERILRPALEKLLPVMACSCWGFCPKDFDIVFDPIIAPTPEERANLVDKLSTSVFEAFKCGLISRREAIEELKARGEDLGVWTKLDEGNDPASIPGATPTCVIPTEAEGTHKH